MGRKVIYWAVTGLLALSALFAGAARSLSDTFAGIQLSDVPPFIAAQLAGALAANFLFRWLVPNLTTYADQVVVPHSSAHEHG
jgi:glycerol uptake facilitator-like aquaporin